MSNTAVSQSLLQLLVRVYNQSIQSYYFFPEVIICGNHRLGREEFESLLGEGFIVSYHTDSFGNLYRLTKKADVVLREQMLRRRQRQNRSRAIIQQAYFSFA